MGDHNEDDLNEATTARDHEQQAEEALRVQLVQEIEAARAQIEAQLAQLMAMPNRAEFAQQINAVQGQLSQLDGIRGQAATGTLAQLSALQVGLSFAVASVQIAATSQITMAGNAAHQSIMLMSQDQLAALEQDHAAQSAQFQSFEADMFARIDALAAANGVDASAFHARQRQLLTEYEEAKARGDLAGMLEADALRATNVLQGLEEVGASQAEIDAAREQEQAAQDAYLDQTAIDARREAEAKGMSVEAAQEHVAGEVAQAGAGLEERKEEYGNSRAAQFQNAFKEAGFEVETVAENAPPSQTPRDGAAVEARGIG